MTTRAIPGWHGSSTAHTSDKQLRSSGSRPSTLTLPAMILWGAQRRSCSWPVFVEQTAEQIASTNLARLILADNRQPSRSVRCRKPERSMRTMPVVVLNRDLQDLLQVASS
jgi:hypothetical protein